jgi:transcriptional regulator with XRE-family HTH domain
MSDCALMLFRMTSFGTRLKAAREAKGLSQAQLGRGLGAGGADFTRGAVSHWEMDRHEPTLEQLAEICRRLDCSADYLVLARESTLALSPQIARLAKEAESLKASDKEHICALWEQLLTVFRQRAAGGEPPISSKHQNAA